MSNPTATHGPSRRRFLRTAAWAAAVGAWPAALRGPLAAAAAGVAAPQCQGKRRGRNILVVGASLGGVAATLAAARLGRTVILTEETSWIGGQATTQGVPVDGVRGPRSTAARAATRILACGRITAETTR